MAYICGLLRVRIGLNREQIPAQIFNSYPYNTLIFKYLSPKAQEQIFMLTESKIKSLKSKEKRYEILDGNGLRVRVYPSGLKVYIVRVMAKCHTYTEVLGNCKSMTLLDARLLTCHMLSNVEDKSEKTGHTFESVYNEWFEEKKIKVKPNTIRNIRLFASRVLPSIGKREISLIDDNTLKVALEPYEKQNKIVAIQKSIATVNEIMKFAYSAGYIDRIKTLYAVKRFAQKPATVHHAWIDPDQLNIVLSEITKASELHADFFLFSIYSMLRANENASLEWSWIDWRNNLLTIPAEQMKMKRPHQVPLSSQMLQILRKMKELNLSDTYVFVAVKSNVTTHIDKASFSRFLKAHKLSDKCSAHGMRATARTWMARVHIPEQIAEVCLAHVKGNAVELAYNHESFLEERRKVVQQWCDFVDSKK